MNGRTAERHDYLWRHRRNIRQAADPISPKYTSHSMVSRLSWNTRLGEEDTLISSCRPFLRGTAHALSQYGSAKPQQIFHYFGHLAHSTWPQDDQSLQR